MNRWHIKLAALTIQGGGIVAYPTEAVYGLGCDPDNAEAVQRLLTLKQRPMHQGLILIAARFEQLHAYLRPLTSELRERVIPTWPGPVTWLLPARPETPPWLRGRHQTLAVRVTAHPLAAALCEAAGTPLVSTSANLSGRPPARNALGVRRIFGDQLDYILPGESGGLDKPTEIRDGLTGRQIRAA